MGALNAAARHAGMAAIGAAALLLAGCPGKAHIDYTGPYADKVAADVPKIENEVGVRFKRAPRLELRTREQVRTYLIDRFNETDAQQQLAGEEAADKLFGLIPDTMHLRNEMLDLLTEQIIGFYDPRAKTLYVVKDAPEDQVGLTIMHELVHALQDQYVNLDSIQHVQGDDDRQLATQAVIEGQAMFVQVAIMTGSGNIAAVLPGGWDRIRQEIRDQQTAMPRFTAAPMAIQEELLFPYINGADFVRRFRDRFPGKLPFDNMPVSTEQVMHDSAYFGAHRDAPVRITMPSLPNKLFENDMGEFGTRLFFYRQLGDLTSAARAAGGWGGDHYEIVKTSAGNALVWATAWDTGTDAAEFVDALGQLTVQRYSTAPPVVAANGTRTYRGATRTVVITPREVNGIEMVLVEDVPAGVSTDLVDVSRIGIAR